MDELLAKFTLARSSDERCRLVTLCPILLSDKAVERLSTLLMQMPSNHAGTERLRECLDFLHRGQREGIIALCPSTSLGDWEGPSLRPTRPMVEILAGPCIIGSDRGDTERAEAPARSALVDTFLLDKHPVTNRDYAAFLANTGYPPSEVRSQFQISGEGASEAGLDALASLLADSAKRGFTAALATTKPDFPVVEISWFDAVEFCRWAHMRLPTADQWEKAARGPNALDWSYGSSPDRSKCNVRETNLERVTSVTEHDSWPSPYGCCDMSGNAMEWTATPVEGSHLLEPEYVIKGGCWSFSIEEARSWKRHTDPPGDLWNALGFRGCVQSASAEDKTAADERARIRELGDLFAAFIEVSPFDAIANEISGLPASKSRQIAFDFVDYIDAQLLGRLRNRQAVAVLDGLARIAGMVADRLGDSECAVRATYAKALILLAEHNGAGSIELLEGCVNHYRQTGAEKELAITLVALAEAESSRNLTFGRDRLDAKSAQAHVEEALSTFRRLRMPIHEQRALRVLSTVLRQLEDPQGALRAALLSLSGSVVYDDELEEAEAMFALSAIFGDLHAVAHALYCARMAARVASARGDSELFVEARLQQFLFKTFENRRTSVRYGAETLEIVALLAPAFLDQALRIIHNRARDPSLGWTIGSYLGGLVGLYMSGSSLPFAHMAEIAIAHAFDELKALPPWVIPNLKRLLTTTLTPKESSALRAVLAFAVQDTEPAEAVRHIDNAVASADDTGEQAFPMVTRQIRIEINRFTARWDAVLADLKLIRPQLEQQGNIELAVAYLEYEARVSFWAGNIRGALEACDAATIATEQLDSRMSSRYFGRQHLLRSRILSSIGSEKATIEAFAAQMSFFAAEDVFGSADQLICFSQAILDLPEDHAILMGKAAEYLDQANMILDGKRGGMTDDRLSCDLSYAIATFYTVHGNFSLADQTLERLDTFAQEINYRDIRVPVLASKVRVALNSDNLSLALKLADELVAIARARQRPIEMITAFDLAGRVYGAHSRGEQARAVFTEAIGLYHTVRGMIESPILRKEWLRFRRAIFEHFAQNVLLEQGSHEEALNVMQQTKTASLGDLLRDAKFATGTGYGHDAGVRIASLWRSIQNIEIEIEKNAGIVGREANDYRFRVELRQKREELDALRAGVTASQEVSEPNENWEELRHLLVQLPNCAIVELFVTESETIAFVGSATRPIETVVRLAGLGRGHLVERMQEAFGQTGRVGHDNSAGLTSLLEYLHHALFYTAGKDGQTLDAALKTLGARQLILIPSGVLSLLPLQALFSQRHGRRHWLIDEYESFSYAPSIEVLVRSAASAAHTTGSEQRVLAVQDPDGSLAHAQAEVRMIRSVFPATSVLAREQATKENVREAYSHADIVHFACHGEFNRLTPYDSGLLLNDGILPLSEIYLSLNSRGKHLIVLSACETASVSEKFADEFLSISSGFIYGGARRVISALWSVADNSTALLMQHFYEQMAHGVDGPIALARAQRWLRDVTAGEIAALYAKERQSRNGVSDADYVQISAAWRRFAALESDQRPFGEPIYWAGFRYIGL